MEIRSETDLKTQGMREWLAETGSISYQNHLQYSSKISPLSTSFIHLHWLVALSFPALLLIMQKICHETESDEWVNDGF
jgi:hypothetical protein